MRSLAALALVVTLAHGCLAQGRFTTGALECEMRGGTITFLRTVGGDVLAAGSEVRVLSGLRRLEGDLTPAADTGETAQADLPVERSWPELVGKGKGRMSVRIEADAGGEGLVLRQSGESDAGLHAVRWGITGIPLDYSILVPGHSGLKLTRDAPGSSFEYSYPMSWEAQFVIIEGKGGGFWVWAEDPLSQYKSLRIWKRADCWEMAFETQNLAPFADKTSIASVKWRLAAYKGDWRVPARQYRDWAHKAFGLTRIEDQQPEWVRDIRLLVICGMDLKLLDTMAERFDATQTCLYVPDWRVDGYDRNYPDYTAKDGLTAFLDRAHQLGFRVMLHVNYFGCDPKNPEYERFEKYHARDPFSGEKLWWTWPYPHKLEPGEEPAIKFAYINPASSEWRKLFVSRMVELCTKYPVDALHLDQTLCIWNHAGGMIDGMTMAEGNIAEHQELRMALPHVALSGEGLNEVTFRHEAFAQRHAWGLNHSEGTWHTSWLRCAHAVSSYLLRPYTIINGYLGQCPPENSQLYAAWMEAYSHWGVIPTWSRPTVNSLESPVGFEQQLMTEALFYQNQRLGPDTDGDWPEGTRFAFRAADGTPAWNVSDQGFALLSGPEREMVSRTITGVSSYTGAGSVVGWRAYNERQVFGLDPSNWYAVSPEPGDPHAFHVTSLPPDTRPARITLHQDVAVISTLDTGRSIARFADLIDRARTGYTVYDGGGEEFTGALGGTDCGASFQLTGTELLSLHPPWRAQRKNPNTGVLEASGTGTVYAKFQVKLPSAGEPKFLSRVFMDKGAIGPGKTDGVTFTVDVSDGETTLKAQKHATESEPVPLELDLTELRGKTVTVTLSGDTGPSRQATFDWGRWENPRIERDRQTPGVMTLVSPIAWRYALGKGDPELKRTGENTYEVSAVFPGAVCLVSGDPLAVDPPCDMTKMPFSVAFVSESGEELHSPQYAGASVAEAAVGGVSRKGFTAHPPNHGQTHIQFLVNLAETAVAFHSFVGLRDGSRSEGCVFRVLVNGEEVASRKMMPGQWEEISADLTPWAEKTILFSLVTDSDGPFNYDWAMWGEPRVDVVRK